jgi:hypothetical protein
MRWRRAHLATSDNLSLLEKKSRRVRRQCRASRYQRHKVCCALLRLRRISNRLFDSVAAGIDDSNFVVDPFFTTVIS